MAKKQRKQSRQAMPREGYKRAAHIVREDLIEKVQALACWERKEIKLEEIFLIR